MTLTPEQQAWKDYVNRESEERRAKALAEMTTEEAITLIQTAAKVLGDNDYLSAEHHLIILADWLKTQQEKNEFQRAGVQGTIIGALAGGHMDGRDSASYSKAVLANIADMMDLEVPEEIKKANGLHW